MTPHKAQKLPLKQLKWEKIIPFLGPAHRALGHLDEASRDLPFALFETSVWEEAVYSAFVKGSAKDVLLKKTPSEKIDLIKKALDKVIHSSSPLNTRLLCQIHAITKQNGPSRKDIGRIRTRQNWIGTEGCPIEEAYFLPPPPKQMKPLLNNLQTYIRSKESDPLVQCALYFAQLLIIHPFMDGNGRVARILIPYFIRKKKLLHHPILFLSRYFEENRLAYFQKLFHLSDKKDWEDWIIYFLNGVTQSALAMKNRADSLRNLYEKYPDPSLFKKPVLGKPKTGMIKGEEGLYYFKSLLDLID